MQFPVRLPLWCCEISAAFGEARRVVVSGINAGTNMGRSALHSGTVGAALTAQNFGMRGLAVSLSRGAEWHWDVAAQLALDVLNKLIRAPSRCVLNLNVPGRSITEIEGIRWTRLAPYNSVRTAITQTDSNELKLALVRKPYDAAENTDLSLLEEGFATVSSIHGVAEVWNESLRPAMILGCATSLPAATARDRLHPASILACRCRAASAQSDYSLRAMKYTVNNHCPALLCRAPSRHTDSVHVRVGLRSSRNRLEFPEVGPVVTL